MTASSWNWTGAGWNRFPARRHPEARPGGRDFERLFRLAISGDLFREAEPAASKVLEQGTALPTTHALAHLVKIVALPIAGLRHRYAACARPSPTALAGTARDRKPEPHLPRAKSSEFAKPITIDWSRAPFQVGARLSSRSGAAV